MEPTKRLLTRAMWITRAMPPIRLNGHEAAIGDQFPFSFLSSSLRHELRENKKMNDSMTFLLKYALRLPISKNVQQDGFAGQGVVL